MPTITINELKKIIKTILNEKLKVSRDKKQTIDSIKKLIYSGDPGEIHHAIELLKNFSDDKDVISNVFQGERFLNLIKGLVYSKNKESVLAGKKLLKFYSSNNNIEGKKIFNRGESPPRSEKNYHNEGYYFENVSDAIRFIPELNHPAIKNPIVKTDIEAVIIFPKDIYPNPDRFDHGAEDDPERPLKSIDGREWWVVGECGGYYSCTVSLDVVIDHWIPGEKRDGFDDNDPKAYEDEEGIIRYPEFRNIK